MTARYGGRAKQRAARVEKGADKTTAMASVGNIAVDLSDCSLHSRDKKRIGKDDRREGSLFFWSFGVNDSLHRRLINEGKEKIRMG